MKFINYLENITGIGVFPLVSLMIFFVFFMGVAFFIIKGNKDYFNKLSNLPLNSKEDQLTRNTSLYEKSDK
jgi:hypothetical protein